MPRHEHLRHHMDRFRSMGRAFVLDEGSGHPSVRGGGTVQDRPEPVERERGDAAGVESHAEVARPARVGNAPPLDGA
jgi:hypothetical protein